MNRLINRTALRFSDRQQECDQFRAILHGETPLRGLVIHSHGQGGVGKSTLLRMFENECRKPDLPLPTQILYFTAERLIDWQFILDETVDILGQAHFSNYIQLRAVYGSEVKRKAASRRADTSSIQIRHETHIHGNVQGPVHTGSGDIGKSEAISASSGKSSDSFYEAETTLSPEEMRKQLTHKFLQELNNLDEPRQLVWLVDTVEKLDEGTKAWLVELFWEIADGGVERLILVVAGRERLRYEPHWVDRIDELPISNFTEETVLEILLEIGPIQKIGPALSLYKLLAHELVKKSGGQPLQLMMYIENSIGTGDISHV